MDLSNLPAFQVEENLLTLKNYLKKNRLLDALNLSEKILVLDPANLDAAEAFSEALSKLSNRRNKQIERAQKSFKKKDYLKSIRDLHEALSKNPVNREIRMWLNLSMEALEFLATREFNFRKYPPSREPKTQRHIELSRSIYSQGLTYYAKGDIKRAATAWEKSVSFDPLNKLAANALVRAKMDLQK